jgi:hypothetical protein
MVCHIAKGRNPAADVWVFSCSRSRQLPEIGNEGWTIDVRWRKPTNLLIDDTPTRRKRAPIEIVQTDAAPLLRHEARADDEAIRLPHEQFSF